MALIRNIAGFTGEGTIGAAPVVKTSQEGLFSGIVKTSIDITAGFIPGGAAVLAAARVAISLLPEGGLKDWLSRDPGANWIRIYKMVFGRKFNTGNYVLGERFLDQVVSQGGPDSIKTNWNVTDENVIEAVTFFTIVFGVRLTDSSDLDALDSGVDAYYQRPDKTDIPRNAVERAVFLKQSFYPISTYNFITWNLDEFSRYPLVAPIPDPWEVGKLYNGPLPGGGEATNGIILITEETGLYTDLNTGETKGQAAPGAGTTDRKKEILVVGGVMAALYYLFEEKTLQHEVL